MSDELRSEHSSGWQEWSNYVLKALEQHDTQMSCLELRLRKVEIEQSIIKTKFATYVLIAGGLIGVTIEIVRILLGT
jgi:hypothetical protein